MPKMGEIDEWVLRKFELLEEIGAGAYGTVYRARNRSSQHTVALKRIRGAFDNPTDAQRTFREVLTLRALQGHPYINGLIEVMNAGNGRDLYLVLEFVPADLSSLFRMAGLEIDHIVAIIYQLVTALNFLHSGGIVHRDLKPSNVLISYSCEVKLCDFGLARSLGADPVHSIHFEQKAEGEKTSEVIFNESETRPPMTERISTRWYRAPELLFERGEYGREVDIWALGCIFGELVTGEPLFPGRDSSDQLSKVLEGMKGSADSPCSIQKRVSLEGPALDFLLRCLELDPGKRITASEALNHKLFKGIRRPEAEEPHGGPVNFPSAAFQKLPVAAYRIAIQRLIDPLAPASSESYSKTLRTRESGLSIADKERPTRGSGLLVSSGTNPQIVVSGSNLCKNTKSKTKFEASAKLLDRIVKLRIPSLLAKPKPLNPPAKAPKILNLPRVSAVVPKEISIKKAYSPPKKTLVSDPNTKSTLRILLKPSLVPSLAPGSRVKNPLASILGLSGAKHNELTRSHTDNLLRFSSTTSRKA